MPRRRERRPSLVSTGGWSRHRWSVQEVGQDIVGKYRRLVKTSLVSTGGGQDIVGKYRRLVKTSLVSTGGWSRHRW